MKFIWFFNFLNKFLCYEAFEKRVKWFGIAVMHVPGLEPPNVAERWRKRPNIPEAREQRNCMKPRVEGCPNNVQKKMDK